MSENVRYAGRIFAFSAHDIFEPSENNPKCLFLTHYVQLPTLLSKCRITGSLKTSNGAKKGFIKYLKEKAAWDFLVYLALIEDVLNYLKMAMADGRLLTFNNLPVCR